MPKTISPENCSLFCNGQLGKGTNYGLVEGTICLCDKRIDVLKEKGERADEDCEHECTYTNGTPYCGGKKAVAVYKRMLISG